MIMEEMMNERLVRHYSDKKVCLKQVETGVIYADAVDTIPCKFTYEETNISIEEV